MKSSNAIEFEMIRLMSSCRENRFLRSINAFCRLFLPFLQQKKFKQKLNLTILRSITDLTSVYMF